MRWKEPWAKRLNAVGGCQVQEVPEGRYDVHKDQNQNNGKSQGRRNRPDGKERKEREKRKEQKCIWHNKTGEERTDEEVEKRREANVDLRVANGRGDWGQSGVWTLWPEEAVAKTYAGTGKNDPGRARSSEKRETRKRRKFWGLRSGGIWNTS